jgi:hypothetical protein
MSSVRHHSAVGVSSYHDLRRMLQDGAASAIRGALVKVSVKDRDFWYD